MQATDSDTKSSLIDLTKQSPKKTVIIFFWEVVCNEKSEYFVVGELSDGCCVIKSNWHSARLIGVDGHYVLTEDNTSLILDKPHLNFLQSANNLITSSNHIQLLLDGKLDVKLRQII